MNIKLCIMFLVMMALTGCSKGCSGGSEADPSKVEATKPAMPISVSFRRPLLDQIDGASSDGLVAIFTNQTGRDLGVRIILKNKMFAQQKSYMIILPPHRSKELGWLEGWKFLSGEYITIEHEDYGNLQTRVP